ncbi:hypothetical protein RTBOTA2_003598 [Rhodotorula toruloides]|nr:hypothetical protein RTBOTA2_003598 [Rhodotorula toruloides]
MSSSFTSTGDKQTLVQRQVNKGVEQAKEDLHALANVGAQAVKSTAYVYPIKGILYFLSHPKLLDSLKPFIVRSFSISMVTAALMFTFTYFPQVAFLAFISGPLAFVAAVPLVLAESYFIILFLHRTFLTPAIAERIFDAVLVQKGYSDLVENGRSLTRRGGSVELGNSLLAPVRNKFSAQGLVRYLVTLPLNLIPGVGTAVFLFLNGRKAGPSMHDRYFQLKKMDKQSRKRFVDERAAAYTSFGVASVALNLIPLFGPVFSFTSTAGAALWAADLEKQQRGGSGTGAGVGAGADKKDENVDVNPGRVEL